MLSNAWLIVPAISCPSSLEDAMEFWTIGMARGTIARVAFEATNGGLSGPVHGHRELSFKDRAKLFFPPPGHTVPSGSQWWFLLNAEVGYIYEYHRTLRESSNSAAQDINDGLGHIFSHLQLLPYALAGTPTSLGFLWKQDKDSVRLVINPRYYRMASIGTGQRKRNSTRRVTLSKAGFLKRISSNNSHGVSDMGAISKFQNALRQKSAKRANSKRSAAARNTRDPPRPVTKSGTAGHANEAAEQDVSLEDHQDDEDEWVGYDDVEMVDAEDRMDNQALEADEDDAAEELEIEWAMGSDHMDEDMDSD